MFEIIQLKEKKRWNEVVKSFENWDVYYLNEYAHSLSIHDDGCPILIYYNDSRVKICDVVMLQDIKTCPKLSCLEENEFFDLTTPYGYGGPLFSGEVNSDSNKKYLQSLVSFSKENNIVSEFIRFHPLLQNQESLLGMIDAIELKETIYIDTSSQEIIWNNIDSKNRNMIRKAMKNEIEIIHDHGERISDFIEIYEATMDNNHASDYYYFKKEYFSYLIDNFKENMIFFYAIYNGNVISASIFFYNEINIHYHLSGTLPEYRNLASSNLLLYTVSLWAMNKGVKKFHLGGGLGTDDNLFKFKKKFNKNGHLKFYIGRIIFEKERFNQLVDIRKKNDEMFDRNTNFLITYRAD